MPDRRRAAALYAALLALFVVALGGVLEAGRGLSPATVPVPPRAALTGVEGEVRRHSRQPMPLLLAQCLVVIAATRGAARALKRLRQPEVIGEVVGGILLGPSVLGLLWPEASASLFPQASLVNLQMLSLLGLILFMFVVGMELNTEALAREAHTAVLVSHASVVFPFLLGSLLSLTLYRAYAPPGVAFTPFCLFMGIAMSITAFPVLARILREQGLTRTALGTTALTCAAANDLIGWCGLAVVVGVAQKGTPLGALGVTVLTAAYIAVMTQLVGPAFRAWAQRRQGGRGAVAASLALALASALATELIGIHALFGAFLAGLVMPPGALRQALRDKVEDVSTMLLLPIFFALTGLRTQVGLLDGWAAWSACAAVVAVAVAGKLGGSAVVGRAAGMPWRDALAVGTLMNTRGLMELVVLNIGYDLGIIPPTVFTMMVLMALATTMMTGPLLGLLIRGTPLEALSKERASA